MKKLILLSTLLLSIFYFSSFTFSTATGDSDPSFVRSFNVDGPVALSLSTSGGSIKVEQGNQDKVLVEFYVRKNGKIQNMSLDQLREHKEVNVSYMGNEIEISVKNKGKSWRSSYSVAFVAKTPRKTSVNIATSGGSLSVHGIDGNQRMATSGGSITLGNIIGEIDARTSGGSIKGAQLFGNVNVATSGGSIKMTEIDGKLDAATSGGSISLTDMSGSASAATSGGSITANFRELDGNLSLATSGGNIKVDLPNDVAADIDLRASSSVSLDISGFQGEAKKTKMRGSLNGGGYHVECATSGGSVKVY